MSRSWTERMQRVLMREHPVVMLTIAPDRVEAVWLTADDTVQDSWGVDMHLPADTSFAGAPVRTEFTNALRPLAERLAGQYVRVLVSVPDAAASINVFSFDQLPWRRSAQEKLLRWRLNKQRGTDVENVSLQWQAFRNGDGKVQVWTSALASDWRDTVLAALADSDIVPAVLDIEGRYLFNWLQQRGHVGGQAGALLNVSAKYFGLIVWDDSGRPAWFRSRWRDRIARDDSLSITERMVSELQRLVFAYTGEPHAVQFRQMFLAQTGEDERLTETLARQLGIEVTPLIGLIRSADTKIVGNRRALTLTMAMGR